MSSITYHPRPSGRRSLADDVIAFNTYNSNWAKALRGETPPLIKYSGEAVRDAVFNAMSLVRGIFSTSE